MGARSDERPVEIEAKFRVADRAALERRLAELGAAPGPAELERNALLDDPDRKLLRRGGALRVREVGGRGVVTLKGKATLSGGVKSRLELESDVAEPRRLLQIFEELGFSPRFVYEKRRATWRFEEADRPLVTVDETPIGLFAEVEGGEREVRALLEELDVPEKELVEKSYAALYFSAREADPRLPEHMTFDGVRAALES